MNPIYLTIINDIKKDIARGTFKPGDKIPSENVLKHKYKVSNATVVRALQVLVQEDVLVRIQGKGTYISKSIHNQKVFFSEYCQFNDEKKTILKMDELSEVDTKVINLTFIQSEEISKQLGVPSTDQILQISRLRKANNIPWMLQNNYMTKNVVDDLELSFDFSSTSISEQIQKQSGINTHLKRMKETIGICYPNKKEVTTILEVPEKFPLFQIKRVTYHPEANAFEYIESYIRGDYYYIEIEQK